jgi:hypothetical protein
MAFDVTVQPIGFSLVTPEEGSDPQGIQLVVTVGMALPFERGPGQGPVLAPVANVRIPLTREAGLSMADAVREACEKLPKESDLTVATSLAGVDRLADLDKKLR